MNKKVLVLISLVIIVISLFYDDGTLLNIQQPLDRTILLEIRIPRIMMGILAGVILSISGLVFQTVLNNYLADSFSLGLASGASFGSATAAVLGFSLMAMALSSIIFSLLTLILVILASHQYRFGKQTTWLVLFGMFVNLFFSSLLYLLLLMFPKRTEHIMNYLFGSINSASVNDIQILIPVVIICLSIIFYYHKHIEVLALGNEQATALGMHSTRVLYMLLTTASIMSAVLISMTGIIGFVGLIIPPLVQSYVKGTFMNKMMMTMLLGIIFILIGDLIGRLIMPPVQVPVSVMMCLIGGPVLMLIMIKKVKSIY